MNLAAKSPRGFTLVEILVAVGIISALIVLVITYIPSMRNSAETASCTSNLRQLGSLIHLYAQDNNNRFPPIRADNTASNATLYWRRAILPYMGLSASGDDLYKSKLTCPLVRRSIISAGGQPDVCSFGMNIYLSEVENSRKSRGIPFSRLSTPAKTLMATESYIVSNKTPSPELQQTDFRNSAYDKYWNPHRGMQNILYCDGHIEAFRDARQLGDPPYNPKSPQDIWTP